MRVRASRVPSGQNALLPRTPRTRPATRTVLHGQSRGGRVNTIPPLEENRRKAGMKEGVRGVGVVGEGVGVVGEGGGLGIVYSKVLVE